MSNPKLLSNPNSRSRFVFRAYFLRHPVAI